MDPTSAAAVRRAVRCLLIMEASASARGGTLSKEQLVQVVAAQCAEARRVLAAALCSAGEHNGTAWDRS